VAPQKNPAAAQLDHFLLRKKLGLEQCSPTTPDFFVEPSTA
jgi:hypothetical protein